MYFQTLSLRRLTCVYVLAYEQVQTCTVAQKSKSSTIQPMIEREVGDHELDVVCVCVCVRSYGSFFGRWRGLLLYFPLQLMPKPPSV